MKVISLPKNSIRFDRAQFRFKILNMTLNKPAQLKSLKLPFSKHYIYKRLNTLV